MTQKQFLETFAARKDHAGMHQERVYKKNLSKSSL